MEALAGRRDLLAPDGGGGSGRGQATDVIGGARPDDVFSAGGAVTPPSIVAPSTGTATAGNRGGILNAGVTACAFGNRCSSVDASRRAYAGTIYPTATTTATVTATATGEGGSDVATHAVEPSSEVGAVAADASAAGDRIGRNTAAGRPPAARVSRAATTHRDTFDGIADDTSATGDGGASVCAAGGEPAAIDSVCTSAAVIFTPTGTNDGDGGIAATASVPRGSGGGQVIDASATANGGGSDIAKVATPGANESDPITAAATAAATATGP